MARSSSCRKVRAAAQAGVYVQVNGYHGGEPLGEPDQVVEVLLAVHRQVQVAADEQPVRLVGPRQIADGRQHENRSPH